MNPTLRIAALAAAATLPFTAQAYGPDDFRAWLKANQSAEPQFVEGDVITYDKADLVRPFIPTEFQSEWIFDGMEMTIHDAGDLTPAPIYVNATQKFAGTATIAGDGAIENYTAGRPFDPAQFEPGSKEDGWKAIWNFMYRWQNEGLTVGEVHWVWVRRGGNHDGHEIMSQDGGKYAQFYGGGGSFERVLTGPYKRVMMAHRADLADSNYKLNNGEGFAKNTEFREYTGFTAPFDIAGTAFLILRYDDPRKADDSWAYIPSLRRVRRISVEVKSDSLLGTDHTLEDFYGFNGRPMEHEWEYVGTARMLVVARSRNTNTVYYGPNGWAVKDDYALRLVDVIRQIPQSPTHPYSEKFICVDRVSGESYYAVAFDKAGELWKVWQLTKIWSEDPQFDQEAKEFNGEETPEGTNFQVFQSINVIDLQNDRGTLVPTRGISAPHNKLSRIKRLLDVNYLTEGR
ncbi:MAG: DUF1329 domain-containing protein [Gammaproteobacteria bacterium]|nr:DUF1329 domain-containing protein [Gammaproteobacteria bacterium]MCP5199919.1 DUF1329 domain-containing protein [Gammaproteobacteria bacterium]